MGLDVTWNTQTSRVKRKGVKSSGRVNFIVTDSFSAGGQMI